MSPRSKRQTLSELAHYEDQLLEVVTRCTGEPAVRDRKLERNGVYKSYAKVLGAYDRMIGDGVEGSEALRRATFLVWCSQTLPASLTGVSEVPQRTEEQLINTLDCFAKKRMDPQLVWMLRHYHGRTPIVFERHAWASHLHGILAAGRADDWRQAEPTLRDFRHRGLMGRYWSQVVSAG